MALTRTNVTLPEELMNEVDALAGPRGRSAFVADAVAYKVKRERLRKALDETRGILVGTPDYMTPEETIAWIDELRSDDRDPWA
jgi:metal-responsive CopG/Arc/MetJ family transcriptional regulator